MLSPDFSIINAGLGLIVEQVDPARVHTLAWEPPAWGDARLARLASMLNDEVTQAANDKAMASIHAVRPQLIGIRPAHQVIDMPERTLLHAGPPIAFADTCGPVRGALIGACLFEGWAASEEDALDLLARGEVRIEPCHHYGAVGPMAGILAPSMPVFVVEDEGRRAFSSLNEGLGKVLRFGAYDASVLERLAWMRDVLGPCLDAALQQAGPIDTTSLFAQALTMGDEGHNRNVAATSLFARRLAPVLSGIEHGEQVLRFLADNDHFTLNLSMAGAKLCMDAAMNIPGSTIVTTMARNGVQFGLRTAGTGDRWFTATVGPADGLFFPGYSIDDANPDLGDSAITETMGIGGFAMAAAPAITRFVGGTPSDALSLSVEMGRITARQHPAFQLPALGFAGSPSGIDVIKVAQTGILPVINTGIAHKQAGIGQIGAGIVRAPKQVFLAALEALASERGIQ